jgi:hypothetical protein
MRSGTQASAILTGGCETHLVCIVERGVQNLDIGDFVVNDENQGAVSHDLAAAT